jgi:hypothetical protein
MFALGHVRKGALCPSSIVTASDIILFIHIGQSVDGE